jgi:hypothetical protein
MTQRERIFPGIELMIEFFVARELYIANTLSRQVPLSVCPSVCLSSNRLSVRFCPSSRPSVLPSVRPLVRPSSRPSVLSSVRLRV